MAGRTYRFMTEAPLYPFGYGLSYTTFSYGDAVFDKKKFTKGETMNIIVPVTNTGRLDGDEVVQVYLKKKNDNEGPLKTLRWFSRTTIPSGKTADVSIQLTDKEMEWWDTDHNAMQIVPGEYEILIGGSSDDNSLKAYPVTIE